MVLKQVQDDEWRARDSDRRLPGLAGLLGPREAARANFGGISLGRRRNPRRQVVVALHGGDGRQRSGSGPRAWFALPVAPLSKACRGSFAGVRQMSARS